MARSREQLFVETIRSKGRSGINDFPEIPELVSALLDANGVVSPGDDRLNQLLRFPNAKISISESKNQVTLLRYAMHKSDGALAEALLMLKATIAEGPDSDLLFAIKSAKVGMANLLIRYRADVNAIHGEKPILLIAAEEKQADIVGSLLDGKARVDSVEPYKDMAGEILRQIKLHHSVYSQSGASSSLVVNSLLSGGAASSTSSLVPMEMEPPPAAAPSKPKVKKAHRPNKKR